MYVVSIYYQDRYYYSCYRGCGRMWLALETSPIARAVLKEYPGVLKDPLAPSDSCGVAARAVQEQCSGVLGNPLTLSDSCGSVARAVPSVLAGGTC
ncbi:hypothetical protein NDU88_001840 [Pleurodeles waltl]|uniref:Uncharacterized protein n=1 Tax=Pleurodeles waltl TaxID=8319 RepID=A0AAV7LEB4_PLEWA|nr:hypothetical protein NDU88_001840 [Pleurodeles waltl]